uniref:EGF-like domain-containing protein n=1 Tax=Dicentrarchus labrax TaxID=13489 RepID=A0A8C4F8C2_DICLA
MASPALLLLLLVSSSLLFSTMSVSSSSNRNQLQKTPEKLDKLKEGAKKAGKVILENIDTIRLAVTPFLSLIPVCGPLIKMIVDAALLGLSKANTNPVLGALKSEFDSLNSKLDKYHGELKWDTWASSAFHKPEKNIEVAWSRYETLVPSLVKETNVQKREKFKQEIISVCSKSQDAPETLRKYLTAQGTTLTENLGKMLADHVKCHEKDIREFTVFIAKLIYKGNTLNQLCYNLKKIPSKDIVNQEAQIAYDSASVMFQIHKNCISHSMKYVITDVKGLIDNTKNRQELAKTIRSFLSEAYDRYEWMVVAFITKNSGHKRSRSLNKHVLTGFTDVPKGDVTVSVARQVKGTYTQAGKVIQAIKSCISRSVVCYKVEKTLRECQQHVNRLHVSQTYTAIHAYRKNGHDSYDAKEDEVYADPENPSAKAPYIYTGECQKSPGVKGGKFVVMIKSDEEMMTRDPCSKLNCGGPQRGTCFRMVDTFVAMCECKLPYYGKNCEQNLEDYKRALESATDEALQGNPNSAVISSNLNIIPVHPTTKRVKSKLTDSSVS